MKSRRFFVILLALVLMLQGAVMGVSVLAQTEASSAEKQYKIWFDEAAPWTVEGFERWSLPLGNGYMGINVFGGVETELLSVTENSVFNPGGSSKGTLDSATGIYYNDFGDERIDAASGGLNLMAKTYIDFAGHTTEAASNYKRELSLDDSVAKVSYEHDGVTYIREYFSTYPDKVTVMRLSASKAGKLSFTLRPEIPFCYDPEVDETKYSYLDQAGDGFYKTGKVTAEGDTITLKGTMEYIGTDFEGLYKVIPQGGTMVAANDANGKNGTITVTGADSVVILLAAGTNYDYEFITFDKAKGMLANAPDPHEKVQGWLDAASAKSFDQLLTNHQADYKEFFNRASLDLGGVFDSALTTDGLVDGYGTGNTANDRYLEEMAFQFGRYLLIASSREGCLPANLQGIWNFADSAAWSGGYWHNINVQMNYWPAFNTGLAELFQSYVDYNEAMRTKAEVSADTYLKNIKSPSIATAGTGENGYTIGTGCNPYYCASASTTGHSGPGTVAFTSLLFWDWYEFTQDKAALAEHVYPAVEGAAKFLSKTVKQYDDGKYLVYHSASPENFTAIDPETGKQLYVHGVGCAFDQQMVYANHLATQQAAKELGYSEEDYSILKTINEQIDKLDPVNVGYSGQVKEYREENFYGEFGEKSHRHISQLVGVYPAAVINGETDAWLDAAAVSLENRGYTNIAWGVIHRMLCWARIQDGEQAFEELETMLTEHLGYSLLSNYNSLAMLSSRKHNNPFQIEANFGYTAAVAEMLVQSQAGYIEFLPALPKAWADGSFQGLTTRGNFAVDADWENGVATSFAIESRSGKECAVKYPNIANAVVKDSQGNTVSFTAEGEDLIRFATTAGETYTITGIPSHTPNLAAPTGLTLNANGTTMDLSWTASEGASTYNVYRAINDEPRYTLVKEGVTGTNYTYEHNIQGYDRVTMRVVAVAADGTESPSALAYSLPVTALEQVKGYLFEGNALQLEFEAAENATEYRAYEDGTLVATSKYPLVVVKNADPTATYTVSAVVDGRESAATVATIYHAAKQDNIMLNKPMALTGRPYWIDMDTNAGTKYDGSLAVNGNTATDNSKDRWAVSDSKEPFSVTADLQGIYKLGTMVIYEWSSASETRTRSDNTKVEALTPDGEWVTIKEGFSLKRRAGTTVDAGGILASQIRFTFQNTVEDKSACIAEITCTGEKIDATNKIELLEAVQTYAGQDVKAAAFTGTGYSGVQVAYILAEPEALAVLADADASQYTVDKAARALVKAATGPNIFKNRTVTPASGLVQISKYSPDMMVDGKTDGADASRLAVSANTNPDPRNVAVTVELDGLHYLEGVFVQEFLNESTRITNGGDVTIEVSADGATWTKVLSGVSLREYRDSIPFTKCSNTGFVLENSVLASQVRMTFYDKHDSKDNITIYELQAYGEKVDESSLYLSSNLLTLDSGKTHTLTPSVTGVTWTSSDSSVVSVDSSGKLTAKGYGSATVTASTSDGKTAQCLVTVLLDLTELNAQISSAEVLLDTYLPIDGEADQVIAGLAFVPKAEYSALQAALDSAKSALSSASTASQVEQYRKQLADSCDAVVAAAKTGTMADDHNHCVCGGTWDHDHSSAKWTAWGDSREELTSVPLTAGNYYLVADIEIPAEPLLSADTTVNLCLNGHDLTSPVDQAYSVFGTLSICDCDSDPGTLSGGANDKGGAIFVGKNGTVNIYGGIFTGCSKPTDGGGVLYIASGGKACLYGGVVENGTSAGYGGNIYVVSGGCLEIAGGTVRNGSTDKSGSSNIYCAGDVTVSGGTVSGAKNGSSIIVTSSCEFNLTGGLLEGSTVRNVAVWDSGTFNMSGGEMKAGSCGSNGGNLRADKGAHLTITGGKISGAKNWDVSLELVASAEGSVNPKNAPELTIRNATVGSIYVADNSVEYDPAITVSGKAVIGNLTRGGTTKPIISFELTEGAQVTFSGETEGEAFGIGSSCEYISCDGLTPALEGTTLKWTAEVSKDALSAAIKQYGSLDVSADSFAGTPLAYSWAKAQAVAVQADDSASQAEVDAATADLINAATKDNIFHGMSVEASQAGIAGYEASKMVDEDTTTRYGGSSSGKPRTISVTVPLDAVYNLEAVFVQEFLNRAETASRASAVKLEVFADGQWTTVFSDGKLSGKGTTGNAANTAFVLAQSVEASQVRITFTHAAETITGSGQIMSIWELQAYGEKLRPLTDENLKFKGAAVCLQDDLSVQFKVNKALLEENGLSDPYAVFEFAGRKITESNFREENGVLVFTLRNIAPHQLGETIKAELYATKDGVLYVGKPVTYSIKQYCQRILAQYNTDAYAELRTLLVDLLNYGAAAQKYVDPSIANDDLVNSWLTTEQKSWGTEDMPAVSSDACAVKGDLVDPAVTCTGVGLYLENSAAIRFKLTADSIDGLTAEFTVAGKTWQSAEFVPVQGEAGSYHVYFRNLNAGEMRETVCCTFYRGGEAVSYTFCYSVECYVANNADNENVLLAELTKAVIRYGDAASQFVK